MSRFLNKHSKVIGKGYFYGKLYDVGAYPAAILNASKTYKVYGTLLSITNPKNTFRILDAYEGVEENLYVKKTITVYLENQTKIAAWAYIYNQPTNHLKLIHTGDYFNP